MEGLNYLFLCICFQIAIVVLVAGIVLVIGLIRLFRSQHIEFELAQRKILKPATIMLYSSSGLIFLFSLIFAFSYSIPYLSVDSQESLTNDQPQYLGCFQLPINGDYHLEIRAWADGKRYVNVIETEEDDIAVMVVNVYNIYGNYIVGHTIKFSRNAFFLFDMDTGGYRSIDTNLQAEFQEILTYYGLPENPEFIPVETLCTDEDCRSCD